MTISWG